MIGTSLSHYRITEKLGQGGMGEVYRAEDTNLSRQVAIKVLPDEFAHDAERLARFEREAKLLASLNHPNIASIYGLEKAAGKPFLVLELVEGQTLSERLKKGCIPLDETLDICRQIAEGLEAAHERGIIHRDLKPANVKVTPEGKVKILDFGLAKAFQGEPTAPDVSKSPTLTSQMTHAGVILGTAAYMSPEQAKGKPVDKRADIWAFGCILYECLTGRRAFPGETVSDTIARILEREPDWEGLPASRPPGIQVLLYRSLRKDPHQRFQHIGDVRVEIEEEIAGVSRTWWPHAGITAPSSGTRLRVKATVWCLIGFMGGISAGYLTWLLMPPARSLQPVVGRFAVPLGSELETRTYYRTGVISPDGTKIVYVAYRGGTTRLFLRALDDFAVQPLIGTEGAFEPFFSPDGRWIGYFTSRGLRRAPLEGGRPSEIGSASMDPRGATWGPSSSIVFTPRMDGGMWRISAGGGTAQPLTTPDAQKGEVSHRWPDILPGDAGILFTIETANSQTFDEARIGVFTPRTGAWKTVIEGGTYARYAPTGHLVFARGDALFAVPFDLSTLQVKGQPTKVLDGLGTDPTTGAGFFSFSNNGSLIYLPRRARGAALAWVDRNGMSKPITALQPGSYQNPAISPDGKSIAVTIGGATDNVWVYGTERGTLTRLTFGPSDCDWAVWKPDGKRILFTSYGPSGGDLFWRPSDASAEAEPLLTAEYDQIPTSWSADGQLLAFTEMNPVSGADIYVLPLDGARTPMPFLQTPFDEYQGMFSPDGKWMAYVSNESGENEIYVRPFPGPGGKWQLSAEGGNEVSWAPNGRELFYRCGNKMLAVTVTTKPTFSASKARVLFEGEYDRDPYRMGRPNYDVASDGLRFLMIQGSETSASAQFHVIINWFEELKRLCPTGK